ncbi:MAG: hypothetical protein ACTSUY_00285 [Alphaproteobacteria bacterium]
MGKRQILWIALASFLFAHHAAAFAGQTPGLRVAQNETPFSCSVFGAGFTPHPEFSQTCCYPGTSPVPGEMRCARPGEQQSPPQVSQPQQNSAPDQCIAKGAVCTLLGTPCCSGTCSGKFPNTRCR